MLFRVLCSHYFDGGRSGLIVDLICQDGGGNL